MEDVYILLMMPYIYSGVISLIGISLNDLGMGFFLAGADA